MFHFHRFDGDQRCAARHTLAGGDVDRDDCARQRGQQRALFRGPDHLQGIVGAHEIQYCVPAVDEKVQRRRGIE